MNRELRRRIAVTLGLVAAAEALRWIPVPGVDPRALSGLAAVVPGARIAHDLVGRASVGALGIGPYVSASILAVLLFLARRRGTPGEAAGHPFEAHALWLALPIALIQGLANAVFLQNLGFGGGFRVVPSPGPLFLATAALTAAAGALLTVALARLISRHGVGNGLCVLVGAELARSQSHRLAGDWLAGGRGLHENAPALALLLALSLWLAVLWLSARWPATESRPVDAPETPEPWWLRANVAGIAGLAVAEWVLALPVILASYLAPARSAPAWMSALELAHPAGAAAFVVLSVVATWLFTAWALDPARLVHALPANADGEPEANFDERRFERRALQATFWSAAGAPVAVVLFGLAVRGLGAPGLSAIALAVLAAVALDTLQQFRAHAAMAQALGPPAGDGSCGVCGGRLAGGEVFCPACGAAFEDAPGCGTHPDEPALARCVVCARPLCGGCALERGGRSVCREHVGVAFVEGWAVVVVAETPVEADGLRRRLVAAGVASQVLVSTCAALRGTLGLYDLTPVVPLVAHASCGGGSALVLVRPGEHGRARELLAVPAG
jgi:preprotein translocase subunit SecY